ncbi:hypothetical protein RI054_19g87380 [Pseudoscourfieldia marina]
MEYGPPGSSYGLDSGLDYSSDPMVVQKAVESLTTRISAFNAQVPMATLREVPTTPPRSDEFSSSGSYTRHVALLKLEKERDELLKENATMLTLPAERDYALQEKAHAEAEARRVKEENKEVALKLRRAEDRLADVRTRAAALAMRAHKRRLASAAFAAMRVSGWTAKYRAVAINDVLRRRTKSALRAPLAAWVWSVADAKRTRNDRRRADVHVRRVRLARSWAAVAKHAEHSRTLRRVATRALNRMRMRLAHVAFEAWTETCRAVRVARMAIEKAFAHTDRNISKFLRRTLRSWRIATSRSAKRRRRVFARLQPRSKRPAWLAWVEYVRIAARNERLDHLAARFCRRQRMRRHLARWKESIANRQRDEQLARRAAVSWMRRGARSALIGWADAASYRVRLRNVRDGKLAARLASLTRARAFASLSSWRHIAQQLRLRRRAAAKLLHGRLLSMMRGWRAQARAARATADAAIAVGRALARQRRAAEEGAMDALLLYCLASWRATVASARCAGFASDAASAVASAKAAASRADAANAAAAEARRASDAAAAARSADAQALAAARCRAIALGPLKDDGASDFGYALAPPLAWRPVRGVTPNVGRAGAAVAALRVPGGADAGLGKRAAVLFGGRAQHGTAVAELAVLATATGRDGGVDAVALHPFVASGAAPAARSEVASVVLPGGSAWLLFGGHDGRREMNDCHVVAIRAPKVPASADADGATTSASRAPPLAATWSRVALHLPYDGQPPPALAGAAACYHNQTGCVLLFGGYASGIGHTNRLLSLDVSNGVWHPIELTGDPPPRPRRGAAIVPMADGSVVVFGGILAGGYRNANDGEDAAAYVMSPPRHGSVATDGGRTPPWTCQRVSGALPAAAATAARAGNDAIAVEEDAGVAVLLGEDMARVHLLDLSSGSWRPGPMLAGFAHGDQATSGNTRAMPSSRVGHGVVSLGASGGLIALGGCNDLSGRVVPDPSWIIACPLLEEGAAATAAAVAAEERLNALEEKRRIDRAAAVGAAQALEACRESLALANLRTKEERERRGEAVRAQRDLKRILAAERRRVAESHAAAEASSSAASAEAGRRANAEEAAKRLGQDARRLAAELSASESAVSQGLKVADQLREELSSANARAIASAREAEAARRAVAEERAKLARREAELHAKAAAIEAAAGERISRMAAELSTCNARLSSESAARQEAEKALSMAQAEVAQLREAERIKSLEERERRAKALRSSATMVDGRPRSTEARIQYLEEELEAAQSQIELLEHRVELAEAAKEDALAAAEVANSCALAALERTTAEVESTKRHFGAAVADTADAVGADLVRTLSGRESGRGIDDDDDDDD